MTKLHIACGDVYLDGYINIDIQGTPVERLNGLRENINKTTIDKYFKFKFGSPRREIIVDEIMDICLPWKFKSKTVDEIVAISILEHLSSKEAKFVLSEMARILKKNGKLLMSVPDIKNTVIRYIEKKPDWCMRLLYCHGRNEYSYHKYGYTFKTLCNLLKSNFKNIKKVNIINHEYPMIQILAVKK